MERPEIPVIATPPPVALLEARRVDVLYGGAAVGFLVAPAVAAVCTILLWAHVSRTWLLAWFASIVLINLARYGLSRQYAHRNGYVRDPAGWEASFTTGTALHGAAWGALIPIVVHASYPLQVFAVFAIGGMVIGAVGLLGASRTAFFAFAVPSMGTTLVVLAAQPGERYLAMDVLIVIFAGAVLRILNDHHRALVQSIERGIVNERLLAEHRGLFDATTAGIAFVRNGRIVDCNRWLERMFGWSREELLAAPRAPWDDESSRWGAIVAEAVNAPREGVPSPREIQLRRKDGVSIWCELSSQTVRSSEPELGVVLVFRDLTARHEHERALLASEERLNLVVRASQGGIWDWDLAANTSYLSPRFKAILRYPPDADLGKAFHFKEHLHPDDAEHVLTQWYRAIASPRTTFDCEFRLRCLDEHFVWVHARGVVVSDETGRAVRSVGSIIDISDRKLVEERLRESERHFRYLVETSNDLVWIVDREGRWSYLSPRATRQIFGCEPEDLMGKRLIDTQPEAERSRTEAMLVRVLAEGTASHFETVHINRNGDRVVLSLNATPLRDGTGQVAGVTGTATDISPLKDRELELSAALEDQNLIFESVSEGIVMLREGVVHKCNRRFAEMLGYSPEELAGRPSVLWYANPSEWDPSASFPRAIREEDGSLHTELRAKRRDGSVFWCDSRGRILNPERPEEGSLWIYIDISARKERETRIQHLADHDALTGLLNRRMFEDRLRQALANARRSESFVALMLVDLDEFKMINDSYGHLTGDYVLRTVAKRIHESVRETDTVARLGGDEFVVVLVGQHSTEDAALVAEKMLGAITEPIPAGGRHLEIGASIGISIFPRDGDSPEALLRHADAAMYRVKDAGKNRFQFYSD
jgi:diguanylate cyclase (GGDEF)-like protein/PAS domain S-box-containing protein